MQLGLASFRVTHNADPVPHLPVSAPPARRRRRRHRPSARVIQLSPHCRRSLHQRGFNVIQGRERRIQWSSVPSQVCNGSGEDPDCADGVLLPMNVLVSDLAAAATTTGLPGPHDLPWAQLHSELPGLRAVMNIHSTGSLRTASLSLHIFRF